MMEVRQVVRITGALSPPHGPGEAYRILVRLQWVRTRRFWIRAACRPSTISIRGIWRYSEVYTLVMFTSIPWSLSKFVRG